ncbi:MAG: AAA domain-containing protein [Acidimicrobiia bacterium]|nr:AAA domain-containing protein [Acidimicrobiia bacterium]
MSVHTASDGGSSDGTAHLRRVSPAELEFRQRWYEAHRKRFLADEEKLSEINNNYAGFEASAPEALELLAGLRRTGDLDTFTEEIRKWARKPDTLDFNGHSGQMMLNQLAKHADDPERLARILAESLSEPGSDQDAVSKIAALADYVKEIKVGIHPAPGHVPFLCSYFWALANRQRWPLIWTSGASYIEYSTGESLPKDQAEKYELCLQRIKELTDDPVEFEKTASWWNARQPVFLDEVLADRVGLGLDDKGATHSEREANARVMVSIAKFWGDQLVEKVATALDRKMTVSKLPLNWTATYPRADLWVDWNAKETSGLGFRVWVNDRGAAVVLRPGLVRKGWRDEVAPILEAADNSGCRVLGGSESRIGDDVGFYGHRGEFVYGRWFDRQEFADVNLVVAVVETAKQLKPLFDEMLTLATGSPDVVLEVPDTDNGTDPLEELADELLIEREFLDDVVALLKDKGQVIFYGPPGTGKTYLARKLAEALTADSSCRALVQFHPSSSYEDFFEGYRPEVDDGDMTYRLTPGPLALIAERAESAPGRQHVMIIDEINRANLPKVLGELLFLLEYRDEAIQTLYRPEEVFVLPPNLWFIGTMNTADRSIAMVDAALRRRFHFIPFFPNRKPIAGLLDRWLEANDQPAWVGELVAQVNDELKDALGGDDLLIGPSHFMRSGLDSKVVRRIWEYNIEPFIEDQFFGDPAKIERFKFNNIYQRYRSYSGQDELEAIQEQPATIEPSDESEVSQASQDVGAE